MSVSDKVLASLSEFKDQLASGERIVVMTVSRCGCNPEGRRVRVKRPRKHSVHQAACHLCRGSGWCRDIRTVLG